MTWASHYELGDSEEQEGEIMGAVPNAFNASNDSIGGGTIL